MHISAVEIARLQVCHAESLVRRFARDRKCRRIFFVERQIVGRMTKPEQARRLLFVPADLLQIFSRDEHNRRRAISDLRAIGNFQRRRDARILVRNLRGTIECQIGIAHLRKRIQFRMGVVFPGDCRQVRLFGAILVDVNLCNAPEKLREHEIAIFGFFVVIIGGRAENIRAIERRHRLLLLCANHQHRIVKPAHDPFRAE